MYMPYFPPRRLRAWRPNRCWQCDNRMTKRPYGWWCAKCRHVVTYQKYLT